MALKRYILDTNIFVRDPRAIYFFEDNDVLIPLKVLEELDQLKRGVEEKHINARAANKVLDDLLAEYSGKAAAPGRGGTEFILTPEKGIPSPQLKGRIYFIIPPEGKYYEDADREILDYLKQEREAENQPILITLDRNLRVRAKAQGFKAQVYERGRDIKDLKELLNVEEEVDLPAVALEQLKREGEVALASEEFTNPGLFHNQYIHLSRQLLAQYYRTPKGCLFRKLEELKEGIYGIRPRNREQTYLLSMCLDEKIQICTALGMAGTGKTVLALAAALYQVEQGKFSKVEIIRPIAEVGPQLGFLKGDLEEKIAPYMLPIRDAVEILARESMKKREKDKGEKDKGEKEKGEKLTLEKLVEDRIVELHPPTFMLGRSLPGRFIIVDEAQNLTPNQVETLATRVGEGTKILFTGDPYQIHVSYVDETSNGLVALTRRLLGEEIFSMVFLKKPERSKVAELVARKM